MAHRLTLIAIALALIWTVPLAAAQAFPSKTVRFVVPFAPGGGADAVGRMVSQKLAERWGQAVVVENRPGGATGIAAEFVAKATPDGHTLLMVANETMAINPSLFRKLTYDPSRDFTPVSGLVAGRHVLLVHPSLPAKNVAELVAHLKTNPGRLSYGSPGNGSTSHLNMESFKSMTSVDIQHIPYKGAAPAMTDLLGGRIQVILINLALAIPHHASGKLNMLAVASDTRSPLIPQMPTVAEAGYKGFESLFWFGIAAPAATPKAVVEQISADAQWVVNLPEIRDQKLAQQGMEAWPLGPELFAAQIRRETERFSQLIKRLEITAD